MKRWLAVTLMILALAIGWLTTTENTTVWPIRNTIQYRLVTWWWKQVGQPIPGSPGTLSGTILDTQGKPVAGAWVLVTRWNGATYQTRSETDGHYRLAEVPAGYYRPVIGAPGYADSLGYGSMGLTIRPGAEAHVDVTLKPEPPPVVSPGLNLVLGEPAAIACEQPVVSEGVRRQVTFDNDGRPNQLTLYYTPAHLAPADHLPTLLAVYPGPADTWECASVPLAAAGYTVIAIGPAYSFELERDIDELVRLADFARAGQLPGSDGTRLGAVAGSYSGLHVLRLLQRDQGFKAALLLGVPTDLFDMRRRLEDGTYVPPFGLDQAMIALGFPDQEPLRYWRYSGAYHVSPTMPPIGLLHSRTDQVVPYQQSELLVANLEAAGVVHESFFFDGASHYLLSQAGDGEPLKVYQFSIDFLDKYLK